MEKTKHSATFIIVLLGVLIILSNFILFVLPSLTKPDMSLVLGDGVFNSNVLSTDHEISKGFSSCKTLGESDACMIVYSDDQKWEVSIESLDIPVDIVWLDSNKKVVYAISNVSIKNESKISLKPKTNARYLVEFAAGTIKSKAINTSRKAIFDLDK